MPHTTHRWSDEDVAKLKSMAQKYSTAAIAAQLGRSTAATIVKAHELKLSLGPVDTYRIHRMMAARVTTA